MKPEYILLRHEVGRAQGLADETRAHGFDDVERLFHMSARLAQIAANALDPGQAEERIGLAAPIFDLAVDPERRAIVRKRLLFVAQIMIERAEIVQDARFPATVAGVADERERLLVVLERFLSLAQ